MDDVALFHEDPSKLQIILDRLNDYTATSEMQFALLNFEIPLQGCICSKPIFVLAGKELSEGDRCGYLDGYISTGGHMSSRMQSFRSGLTNLKYQYRCREIRLPIKG